VTGSNDDWIGGIDPREASPLSSQAVGLWTSPLVAVDSAEAILGEDLLSLDRMRFQTIGRLLGSWKFRIGAALFGTIVVLAILAPLIARYDPNALPDFNALNQNPSPAHWLGTDYLGRDMWARLVTAGRTSLPAGILVVLLSFSIGVPWGLTAGYGHRLLDDGLMRLVDLLLAFPGIILVYGIVAILGSGTQSVVIALGIGGISGFARVTRASTLSGKERDYVLSARAMGASPIHIMRRHLLPNIIDPIVILATLNLASAILATTALSFLGIGTQLPAADWGTMLAFGFQAMFQSWAQVVFPAAFIIISVLGINLIGDSLGDALNPQLQR
jgi:peptide/nickel transport system permease protein